MDKEMTWHVYLVRCSDGSLYCGVSNDVAKRIKAHNAGKGSKYCRSRLPVELVWSMAWKSKSQALKCEYNVKRLTREAKEKLIGN